MTGQPACEDGAGEAPSAWVTTGIHVPRDVLALLRRVAVERAGRKGGRPSVSAVLTELVRANADALERAAR